MCVMPRPVPSTETKRSIRPFRPSLKRYFTPRRSPRPSSPTLPTKVIGARRLDVAGLERAHHRQHHRQPAAVVADAGAANHRALLRDLDVGALGEHGVEVRGEHEVRPRRRARALAEHVADLVDAHVLQPELAELARVELGARRLLERRRLDLADLHLLGQRAGLVGARGGERRLHRGVLQQPGAEIGGRLLGGRGGDEDQRAARTAASGAHGDRILPASYAGGRPETRRRGPPAARLTSRQDSGAA